MDLRQEQVCTRQTYCPPDDFPKTTNLLYRNKGDGTFEDITERSGIAAHPGRSLGVASNDYDNDGRTDLLVANDGMEQFLFHNEATGASPNVPSTPASPSPTMASPSPRGIIRQRR